MIKIYTDAATKGNPGPTGLGVVIIANHEQIQLSAPAELQMMDNHHGEFAAAQFGFKYLSDHFSKNETVLFYTDSRILSDAIGKNYTKHYQNELNKLNDLLQNFTTVVTQWIPEQQNHGAHNLANQALRKIK